MESGLVKKSSSDFTEKLKCPSLSKVINQQPEEGSGHKPRLETQETHVVDTIPDVEGASPENYSKGAHERKKYHNISNDVRMQLIDAVESHGEKIKHVKIYHYLPS